ncbi:sugar efflux transporter [Mesobacillus foraminis]|uniref:SET family sugar efflux transporter-like MFS transporter n=1 Tax=Mesobacillus foraminis TaxID=279826 RepID=A0A4R2B7T7_9BACI|nr:sugar efflux transporter [Mesobacillus foraminis]TCN21449.1 SET family sugar efflux transporter-like MFS transporter [Mesobacillus foraminis]
MGKSAFSSFIEKIIFVWKIPSFPVLYLTNFIFGLAMSFFAPFSSLFGIDEVGMSNIGFGIFMTVMAVGGIVLSTYIAKRSDLHIGRKKLLIITTSAGILGYLCFAFIRNPYMLGASAFLLLGTAAAAVPQLWAYAREALKHADVPSSQTPFVMNIFRMFFALAWTVGPAVAAWLLVIVGFRGLFLFVAAGYALGLLVIIFLLKDIPRVNQSSPEPIRIKRFIAKPHISGNLAAALLLAAATSVHMLNVPQFVTKILGGTEMDVGMIFSVPPIFEVPMMVGVGLLATRFDNGLLIKIGFGLAFIYFALFYFVTEPWQIYPLQILSAAQVSITAGIAISYFQDFIPDAPGTATTLYMNSTQIGSTAGYLLFGILAEAISYGNVILVYAIIAGVALLCLILFGKERVKAAETGKVRVRKI